MSLTGKTLASTYKSLLRVNDDTNGVDATTEVVTDEKVLHLQYPYQMTNYLLNHKMMILLLYLMYKLKVELLYLQ